MNSAKRFFFASVLFTVFAVSGCGSGMSSFHIRQDVDFSYIKRVAVLPLDNLTNDRYAGDIVRHVVISELLASGLVDVAVPGDVMSTVDQMNVKSISSLNTEQIKSIGNNLKVQAVILGAVEKYGEVRVGNVSAPEISITLMMADATSGGIIWSVTRTTGGATFLQRHFGARADTMSESVVKVVRGAVATLAK